MTDPVLDDPAYLFSVQALECLQAVYPVSGYAPGQYCFRVGSSVTFDIDQYNDICCEGLGYVTLGDTYPSSASFPDSDIVRQAQARCPPVSWAQQIKVGIIRCIPTVVDDQAGMPTCTDWTLAHKKN